MRTVLLVGFIIFSGQATANTTWVEIEAKDGTCSATCGKQGLENVLGPKGQNSVCASKIAGKIYAGGLPHSKAASCRVARQPNSDKREVEAASSYCLCTTDGALRSSDYAWLNANADTKNCYAVCSKAAPKYSYAVYGSFNKAWLQVCAAPTGAIGSTIKAGDKTLCNADGGQASYGCLCTQMYAEDLDPKRDP